MENDKKQKIIRCFKILSWRAITTVIITLTAVITVWVYAAFVEPTAGPNSSDQDFTQNILGNNDSNNDFSSSNVASNADGSIIEREEYIQTGIGTTTDASSMSTSLFAGQQYIADTQGVPSANSTDNVDVADVAGNKTDTLVEAVGTTKSLVAYLKGLIQELDQRKVPHVAAGTITNSTTTDVVNITDKGVLTGITQCVRDRTGTGGVWGGALLLSIDGVQMIWTGNFTITQQPITYQDGQWCVPLSFNHRFNTSLRVQHYAAYDNNTVTTYVTYTTD